MDDCAAGVLLEDGPNLSTHVDISPWMACGRRGYAVREPQTFVEKVVDEAVDEAVDERYERWSAVRASTQIVESGVDAL